MFSKNGLVAFVGAFAMFLLTCGEARADLSAKEIIAKSNAATQTDEAEHKIKMTLTNKRGETLEQKMVTRSKTVGGLSRSVTTFLYPEETKGTKFLMIENRNGDDEMKIYIPDLKRSRAISSTQRQQTYMGTDFAYGDLEALDPEVGTHTLASPETIDGHECYVVATTLDPKSGAGYSKITNWISKDNFIPIKTEYYDKDGALKKVKTVQDIYKQGSSWVLKKMSMKDVQKEHLTTIEIVESKPGHVDDTYFSEQFLSQTDKY